LNDPSVFGVLCLHKYFGNFTNFISHAKSIYLKNIGHDRGNTILHKKLTKHIYQYLPLMVDCPFP
jgi:hypothetical protein